MQDSKMALTVKEACAALGNITPPTFYKEVAAGRLHTFTIGRRRFVTPEACREYIREREKAGQ